MPSRVCLVTSRWALSPTSTSRHHRSVEVRMDALPLPAAVPIRTASAKAAEHSVKRRSARLIIACHSGRYHR